MNPNVYRATYACEDTHWWHQGMRACLRRLLEHEKAQRRGLEEPLLLDAGCGTGGNLELLSGFGKMVGIELNPLGATLSQKRGMAPVVQASITVLPFPSETFDVVVAINVLQHVADDRLAIRECYRVLKPNGIAVVTVAAHPVLFSEHDVAVHTYRRYTRLEFEGKLTSAGFYLSHRGYVNGMLLPLVATWRIARRWLYGLPSQKEARPDFSPLPRWLEGLGRHCLLWESRRLPRRSVLLGLSLFAVAQKES